MSFDFNDPSMPIPRGTDNYRPVAAPYAPRGTDTYIPRKKHYYTPPHNARIHLSAITGSYRVFMYDKRIMLHISGGHGKLAGKFNSEHATGYLLSDGQGGDEVGLEEWIDFTYFAEKSSIRSIDDRKRVRAERENMGLIARVQRGHGSLQFAYNRGVVAAAIIFHGGQGQGFDEWFRGPKLVTSYTIAPWFVYKRFLLNLQKRWIHQRPAPGHSVGRGDDEGDILDSDDETVDGVDAMHCEVIGARPAGMYQNRPQLSRRPQPNLHYDMNGLREWAEAKGVREVQSLKELKAWEDGKSPDELDRLRHLMSWAERNGFTGLREMGVVGNYTVTGGAQWPNLQY
ncbi:Phospholipid:diacylglycerol acyltransferase [Venturia nashicola]|nr:Phospholipid:diacylglycerol acyltransferase [Venturia nashicola]